MNTYTYWDTIRLWFCGDLIDRIIEDELSNERIELLNECVDINNQGWHRERREKALRAAFSDEPRCVQTPSGAYEPPAFEPDAA